MASLFQQLEWMTKGNGKAKSKKKSENSEALRP